MLTMELYDSDLCPFLILLLLHPAYACEGIPRTKVVPGFSGCFFPETVPSFLLHSTLPATIPSLCNGNTFHVGHRRSPLVFLSSSFLMCFVFSGVSDCGIWEKVRGVCYRIGFGVDMVEHHGLHGVGLANFMIDITITHCFQLEELINIAIFPGFFPVQSSVFGPGVRQ